MDEIGGQSDAATKVAESADVLPQQQPEMNPATEGTESSAEENPDKCSICLGVPMVDAADLDGCAHRFCFPCITEWIKLRSICPMCKRPITKICHHVRTDGNDEEIMEEVTANEIQRSAVRERIEADSARPLARERSELLQRIRTLERFVRFNDGNAERPADALESDIRRRDYVDRVNRYRMLLDNWERPRREVISDPTFRLLVYELRLRRLPLVRGAMGTRRGGLSPQYFRDNEGTERTRISNFARRELAALLPGMPNLENIVDYVYNLAMSYQIMSPQFSSSLSHACSDLAPFADHFVELLYEFAASGQELSLFDQNSEYISRRDYQRRLTNMNFALFGDTADDDDIRIEMDSARDRNRAVLQSIEHALSSGMSAAQFHFLSTFSDALIGLQRFVLLLETTEEILPPTEEAALGDTVERIVRAYVQYRNRVRNRRENAVQQAVQQNDDQGREIVLSDSSDSDMGQAQAQSSNSTGGENSQAVSRSVANRRRLERARRRRREQRLLGTIQRHRNSLPVVDSLPYRSFSSLPLTFHQTMRSLNHTYQPYSYPTGIHKRYFQPRQQKLSSSHRRTASTIMLSEHNYSAFTAVQSDAAGASSSSAVIDLDNSSVHDDDVMVVSETVEDEDEVSRDTNEAGDDILIDDDEEEPDDVVIDEQDNEEIHPNTDASVFMDEEI